MSKSKPKFKVGQIWMDRKGDLYKVVNINHNTEIYPVEAEQQGNTVYYTYTLKGLYVCNETSDYDLVNLINDVKEPMNTKQSSNRHKYADVIHAWAEGEKVQFKYNSIDKEWHEYLNNGTPNFNANDFEWRIKPKTKVIRYRNALAKLNGLEGYFVITVDVTDNSLDDPSEYNVEGFVKWLGDVQVVSCEAGATHEQEVEVESD